MIDLVGVGELLVGMVTLIVVVLALRSAQSAVQLAEARNEYLQEQNRLAHLREEHKALNEELVRERQDTMGVKLPNSSLQTGAIYCANESGIVYTIPGS